MLLFSLSNAQLGGVWLVYGAVTDTKRHDMVFITISAAVQYKVAFKLGSDK